MVMRTDYCPIDPIVQTNPYPYYTALRQGPAATYLPQDDLWVVPHFRNVWDIVRNPDSYSSKALRALGVGAISTRVGPRPDIRELDRKMAKSLIATPGPPDVAWCQDITYVPTARAGCSSRRCSISGPAGWSVTPSEHMRTELVLDALDMAVTARGGAANIAGVIAHADRGSQPSTRRMTMSIIVWPGRCDHRSAAPGCVTTIRSLSRSGKA